MINYLSIIEFLKSEEYVDKTGCFERLLADRYTTLENCGRTGSSLFLKTFACFLDESIDSKNVLGNLDICHSEFFQSEVNSYRTLYLDFSDFDADGFDTAIGYVKKKMSEVYKQFYDLYDATNNSYFDCLSQEQALDVIEEITSIEDLKASFRRLLLKIGGVEAQRRNKVAVLIDNLVRLETVSSECGYGGEMCDFLNMPKTHCCKNSRMQSKGPDVLLGFPKGFQAFGGFLQSVCGRPGEIDAICRL